MEQTLSDHGRLGFMHVAMPRGYRTIALWVVVVGHVGAGGALIVAPWWVALAFLAPAAFCVMWGTLYPHSPFFGPVMVRLPDRSMPAVWLTFDDGPSADTAALLEVLDNHDAKATFFVVATRVQGHAGILEAIVDAGHDIGNHTDTHPAATFWGLTPRRVARQISDAQATLTQLAGRPPRWFRSVAGLTNPFVDPALRRLGLSRASWTARGFDTVDADDERVLRRLKRAIAPGAILMLHEDRTRPGRSVRLLRALLAELDALGYSTVLPVPASSTTGVATTSQLLNGVRPHSGDDVTRSPKAPSSDSKPSRVG